MKPAAVSVVLAAIASAACASRGVVGGDPDGSREDQAAESPPRLEVTSPERASFAERERVDVRGRVDAPAGVEAVTVSGKSAEVASDGTFRAQVDLAAGITLIETMVIDGEGNEVVDSRAVLAGDLVDQETPTRNALVAHLSGSAMDGLGEMVSDFARGTDWGQLARSQNPVAGAGSGCNHFEAHVTDLSHGGIGVVAEPAAGGVSVDLGARDLRVDGIVEWEAACLSGGTSFVITADEYAMGALVEPAFARDSLTTYAYGVTSHFSGFRIHVSGVPGFVEDTFRSQVRDYLAGMARDWIRDEVPAISREFLGDFADNELAVEVLGQQIRVEARPTELHFSEAGGTVVLETAAFVPGGEGGAYLTTRSPRPEPGTLPGADLEVMVADDAVNQIFAAVWQSGALEEALLPDEAAALGALMGEEIDRATATMLLPPVARFDGEREIAQLTVGDVLIEAYDPAGDLVVRFALSAEIEVAADEGEGGELELATGASRVLAQVLDTAAGVRVSEDALGAVAELVIDELGGQAQALLGAIPVPGLPGAEMTAPSAAPRDGYLAAGARLSFD